MKTCTHCGRMIHDDSTYCAYCGKPVENPGAAEASDMFGNKGGRLEREEKILKDLHSTGASRGINPEDYVLHAHLQSESDGFDMKPVSVTAVIFKLLALVYLGLEIWHLIQSGNLQVENILNYMFLNALIPLVLFAIGSVIQLLSDIRYFTFLKKKEDITGSLEISEKLLH